MFEIIKRIKGQLSRQLCDLVTKVAGQSMTSPAGFCIISLVPSSINPPTRHTPHTMSSPPASPSGSNAFRAFDTASRLSSREQTIEERYGVPENFLEIEVRNPQTHGKCYTGQTTSAET